METLRILAGPALTILLPLFLLIFAAGMGLGFLRVRIRKGNRTQAVEPRKDD